MPSQEAGGDLNSFKRFDQFGVSDAGSSTCCACVAARQRVCRPLRPPLLRSPLSGAKAAMVLTAMMEFDPDASRPNPRKSSHR
jgi:hypothetical protein